MTLDNAQNGLAETLQRVASLPNDAPFGMPGSFYTDPARFAWEKETVLQRAWHCLGRVDELPEPGAYFTIQLLNEPLLVVRGADGDIRTFANVCQHRGMPLVEGSGSTKRFVCPYHAWTYGLEGNLLRATRMKNAGFDTENCRLGEFATQIWNGFIYCSIADDPDPMFAETKALDELLEPYETANFRLVHVAQEIWHTNWKCLVENFMEGYHLSVVHPQTLHGYTPTGLAKKSASGPGFTSYCANYPDGIASRGTGAAGLSKDERQRSSLFARFPSQVASQAASLLVSLSILPQSESAIEVKWTMSVYGDDLDDASIQQRIALWEEVNREDREKLEAMQKTLRSKHAVSGPLAGEDFEGTIRDFHIWLADQDNLSIA